jgi:transketolase
MSGYFTALGAMQALGELAASDRRVVLVTQDFGALLGFTERFPDRHFDVGISEENLIGVAAGLAHAGKLPFVLGMAPFVSMRGFEQIRDDCAYNRNRVKFLAPFAGLEAGPWGATHHAIEDIALLRTIPGMTVLSPADPNESLKALRAAAATDGPVYIRLGFLTPIDGYDAPFRIGEIVALREGDDAAILATGGCVQTALAAHDALRAKGIAARVLNVHTLKPLDRAAVERAAADTGRLVTVEEHFIDGGLGGAVAEILAELGRGRLRRVGVRDRFCTEVVPYPELLRLHGIDAAGVEAAVHELL